MSSTSVVRRPVCAPVGVAMALVLIAFVPASSGESIVGSRHDLSTAATPQVCEFCHTPHHANTNLPSPLWNRAETTQTFTLYGSATMNTTTAQPRVGLAPVPELPRRRQRLDDGATATSSAPSTTS